MKLKKTLLAVAIIMLAVNISAQSLTTQSAVGQNPTTLINNHLAGQGVLLSNAKFNNSTGNIATPQIGTFSYSGTSFPYHSGLIMTTGNVSVANGPNSSGSSSAPVTPEYVDPQLQPYASGQLHGCSALEFNFVAYSDTFAFNYIFGSEEYEEFVNAGYNDVFVFLLSGPDPITSVQTTKNVAIIPHSITAQNPNGIAVTIDNVNHILNTPYYHNNNNGTAVQYDGYTTSLTAQATILACQPYTMHLTVGNSGDNAYDSGVFLEEGSFYSPSVQVSEIFKIRDQISTEYGDTLVQNCRDVDIYFNLPRAILQGIYHADIEFLGNAEEGTDYQLSYLNGSLWSTLNQTNNEVYYHADDSVIRMHLKVNDTVDFGNAVKEVMLVVTTVYCDDYYYNGHPDAGRIDTLIFHLKCNPVIELVDTTIKYCHHGDAITVDMNSGADDLLWQWTPTTGITNPNTQTSDADISSGRTYHVIAKDRYGCQADTAQVDVTIFEQPVADIRVNPENGCAPLPVIFRAVDVPDECDIRWRVYGENAFDTTYTQSSQLHLTLGDAGYYDVNLWLSTAPGCSDSLTLHNAVHVSDFPHAMLSFSPDEPNNGETVYFYNESTGSDINSYFWNFGDGGTSTTQNPEHAYHVTASDNMTVHFVVTNIDGCEDDTTFVIPVVDEFSLYVPNSFTPNEDGVNDVFQPIARDVAFYRLMIYDRYGSLFFTTEDTEASWDGTIGGKPAPAGVYVWTIEYIRYSNPNRTLLKKGSVTLVR